MSTRPRVATIQDEHAVRKENIATHLDQLILQAYRFELYALVLHIDIQVTIARADGAIALYHPAFVVVEGW
jgi:hypothetical protein